MYLKSSANPGNLSSHAPNILKNQAILKNHRPYLYRSPLRRVSFDIQVQPLPGAGSYFVLHCRGPAQQKAFNAHCLGAPAPDIEIVHMLYDLSVLEFKPCRNLIGYHSSRPGEPVNSFPFAGAILVRRCYFAKLNG